MVRSSKQPARDELSGLRELNRIVMDVLSAIRTSDPDESERGGPGRIDDDERNVIYPENWPQPDDDKPASTVAGDDNASWENPPDAATIVEEPGPDDLPDFEIAADASAADVAHEGPLDATEREFVRRTVRWLERRPNKDVLMDQIWRGLLDADGERPDASHESATKIDASEHPTQHDEGGGT